MQDLARLFIAGACGVAVVLMCQTCGPSPTGPQATGLVFALVGADSATAPSGTTAQFLVAVKNNGPSPVTLTCIRNIVSVPGSDWSSSFCIGEKCVSPLVDSTDANIPTAVGATDTCRVDVVTGTSTGIAQIGFKIYNKADPSQIYEHTFSVRMN